MSRKQSSRRLAAGDLQLLEMLWRDGPVTILEAQQALGSSIGYTTVQTRLNRLVAKGVAEKTAARPAKYTAAVTREEVGRNDLDLLVERVGRGSVAPLVACLIDRASLTSEELAELKELLADAEARLNRTKPPGQSGARE